MRDLFRVGVAALGLLLLAPQALADALLDQARARLEGGDPQAAYDLLAPQTDERAGDPVYDYLLGISALDTGRATEAVFALERVLAVQPDNALARAEIARAYLALNEVDTARLAFEDVAEAGIPPEATATVERYLAAIRAAPFGRAGKAFRAFIAAGVGYDSNPAAASSDLGVDTLGAAGRGQFGRFSGGISVKYPVRPNLVLVGAANGFIKINNQTRNANQIEDFDQADVNGLVGIDYLRGRDTWSLALIADQFRLDNDAQRNLWGLNVQWRRAFSNVNDVAVYGQVAQIRYHGQEFRNVNRWVVGANYNRAFNLKYAPTAFAGLYAGTEANLASGRSDMGHRFAGLRLGGRITLHPKVFASLSFNFETRSYDGVDQFWRDTLSVLPAPFPGVSQSITRHDDRVFVRVAVDYTPIPMWVATPSYQYTMANSSLPTTDYNRHVIGLTIRREFR